MRWRHRDCTLRVRAGKFEAFFAQRFAQSKLAFRPVFCSCDAINTVDAVNFYCSSCAGVYGWRFVRGMGIETEVERDRVREALTARADKMLIDPLTATLIATEVVERAVRFEERLSSPWPMRRNHVEHCEVQA